MHIETLKMFCDLAELRSFSKTAEKHLLSQSAVSQQLAQLELIHKCQLVNRKKRPIELTSEGKLLHKAARDICDRYDKFKSQINASRISAGSRLDVAAIFSIGMHELAGYVKKFMIKYPNVNMHIEYLDATRIYELVGSGDINIGLVAVPTRDRRFEVYDFKDEPLVFVCSPRHSLAGESKIDIQQVQYERFIAFESQVPTRKWIDSIFERYGITVTPMMEFDNIETIKRAVEINTGVSILPQTAIVQELESGTLRSIPFLNESFTRPTGIIVRKDKVHSQAGEYFIELLRGKK